MSIRAEVLVIGPKAILEKHGVLDYPLRFYADVPDEAIIFSLLKWGAWEGRIPTKR